MVVSDSKESDKKTRAGSEGPKVDSKSEEEETEDADEKSDEEAKSDSKESDEDSDSKKEDEDSDKEEDEDGDASKKDEQGKKGAKDATKLPLWLLRKPITYVGASCAVAAGAGAWRMVNYANAVAVTRQVRLLEGLSFSRGTMLLKDRYNKVERELTLVDSKDKMRLCDALKKGDINTFNTIASRLASSLNAQKNAGVWTRIMLGMKHDLARIKRFLTCS